MELETAKKQKVHRISQTPPPVLRAGWRQCKCSCSAAMLRAEDPAKMLLSCGRPLGLRRWRLSCLGMQRPYLRLRLKAIASNFLRPRSNCRGLLFQTAAFPSHHGTERPACLVLLREEERVPAHETPRRWRTRVLMRLLRSSPAVYLVFLACRQEVELPKAHFLFP